MAEKIFTSLAELAQKVSLDKTEKKDLKQQFLAFTDSHPAENGGRVISWVQVILKARLLHSPIPYIAGVLLIAITGGGVSYSANSSLPGDALYPVKVSINEELIGLVHNTPQSKARYEARRLSERLNEVNQLSLNNRVNAEVWHKMSLSLEAHVATIKEYIDAQDITPVATSSSSTAPIILPEPNATTTATTSLSSTSTDSLPEIATTSSSSEEILQEHETTSKQILEATEQLGETTTIEDNERDEIEDQLQEATNLFREGLKYLEDDQYRKAINSFTEAQETVKEIDKVLKKEASERESAYTTTDVPSEQSSLSNATSTPSINSTSSTSSNPEEAQAQQ